MLHKNIFYGILFFVFSINNLFSQSFWKPVEKEIIISQKKEIITSENNYSNYTLMSFQLDNFKKSINTIQSKKTKLIELPDIHGKLNRFSVTETSYLSPKLAAKFPSIKSYTAKGIDTPTLSAKISIGTDGFHATIFNPSTQTLIIEPYTKDQKEYIIHEKSDLKSTKNNFKCEVNETIPQFNNITSASIKNVNDGNLRTYRLALACTGEYSQFHLNQQGVPTSASETTKKAAVLSAINTTMTRVNSVFENDLAVRMILVDNNDQLIFLDATTDDLDNSDPNFLINQSQTKCDDIIGTNNYDIGHTFSTAAGGLAELRSVCNPNNKANGITGRSQPIGDTFDIDYVAHEIGHQFGATHTFNNSCNGNRTNSTAIEPGSGSTIMGYAGICSPNVQNVSDVYFHSVSIAQMWNKIQNNGGCATITNTGNTAPNADAGLNYSIPKSTPFVLRGTATDANGTASLTYNWEQQDNEVASMPPLSTNNVGPAFRSLPSKVTPNRYMPDLATVVAGNTSTTWEVLPSVPRYLNFSFFVRDNNAGGGSSARDDMKVTVTNANAFIVTSPSSAVSWNVGSTQTIIWNKGTTDLAPINCSTVNIRLSIDGGLTFPIILKSGTSNDGTEDVIIPDNATFNARIMVEAADNIFYNVNSTNFTINPTSATFLLSDVGGAKTVLNTDGETVSFIIGVDFVNGFNETVSFSGTGNPTGSQLSFNPANVTSDGNVTLTVSNLNNISAQTYTINIVGTSNSVTKDINLTLEVKDAVYCDSKFSDESGGSEHITNVTFNTINNSSGNDKVDGYEDFTSIKTNVKRGDNHQISVTFDTAGYQDNCIVYIDWNRDYVFDTTTEKYDLGTGFDDISIRTLNIVVPDDAKFGNTRMRVVLEYTGTGSSHGIGACDSDQTSEWGETEDYSITVDNTASIENFTFNGFNIYPSPTKGEFTLSLEPVNTDKLTIQLFDLRGRMVGEKNYRNINAKFLERIQFENRVSGLYFLKIINGKKQTTRKLIFN